jgi:hypothetical protein
VSLCCSCLPVFVTLSGHTEVGLQFSYSPSESHPAQCELLQYQLVQNYTQVRSGLSEYQ